MSHLFYRFGRPFFNTSIRSNYAARSLHDAAYINGSWVTALDKSTYEVRNPATGELLGSVPNMGKADAERAIQSASIAFSDWKNRTAKERSQLLRKWYELILANINDLAKTLTIENGKPMSDSMGEMASSAGFIEWYAEEAKRLYGDIVPAPIKTRRVLVLKQPIGVVGAITPWNFPNSMITRKIGAALAAGCTAVVKPAEDTPFSALALVALAEQAGIPAGVINVVTSAREKAPEVGATICESPLVAKISFTGSTATGQWLLQRSASTVKRVSLELGGNAPFVVFESADLDAAVNGALASRFRCSGQTCVCANRILVHQSVYQKFTELYLQKIKALKMGNGLDPKTTQGPLINERAVQKMETLVADAVKKGARLLVGGKRANSLGPLFFEPTLLADTRPGMLCVDEEIFGPVASVHPFKTEAEAIKYANSSVHGLAGYFFSRDPAQQWRVAEALEFGMVGCNEGMISMIEAPFGGVKQSGFGREGGRYGLDDYLNIKYVCIGGVSPTPA